VAAATDFVVMLSNGVLDTCNFQLTHGHTVADARHAAVSAFAGDYLFVSFDDPVADTAALWNVSYDSTVGMTAFTNGLETDTAAPLAAALDAASERFALGGSDQGEFNFTGDIGEVLLYSRSLDSTERELVQDYLAGKWGLTLGE
jgi:hypothetical protein